MSVETVGNPPPETAQIRASIEKQLPDIIASFSQVLQNEFGLEGLRVGGFTLVPAVMTAEAADSISCDEEGCSID
ncbi:MAG: hypothetical protein HC800_24885 [Phormidesmis sp. RL_2_1]|nr:hypothetical protein [Phormidesmis sp. RL_2_1]